MSVSFNIEQLRAFLQLSKAPKKDAQEVVSIFNKCDENKDSTLADKEVTAFKGMCLMKLGFMANSMLRGFLDNVSTYANMQQLSEAELAEDRKILEQKVREVYEEARAELITQFKNGKFKYTDPKTGDKVPAENLIKYFKGENMTFAPANYGAAQAHKDKGSIEVNTTPGDSEHITLSSMYNTSKEEAMKILLHEALHCAYPQNIAVQEEEMFVESNAIKLMAQIIENSNGAVDDVKILQYGETISELAKDDSHLESVLQGKFINQGYEHRIKNAKGDVNIEGYEIKGGNTVYINGEKFGCVGDDLYLDELYANDIRLNGIKGGQVYMSVQKDSIPIEIKNENDEIVFRAYFVPSNEPQPKENQPIEFKNKKGDNITLQNGDIITIGENSYCIGKDGVELQALDGFRGQLAIIRDGENPELISDNLIFDEVPPDDNRKDIYRDKDEHNQYKTFNVSDKNGSPKYKGKVYL